MLDSQETDTRYNMQGGVPARFPPESEDDKDVRVDYVQHSMSAMIAYETYLQSGREKKTGAGSKVRQMIANNKHLRIDGAEGDSTLLTIGFLLVIVLVGIAAFSMIRKPKKTRVL